jgi:hypothetical protein
MSYVTLSYAESMLKSNSGKEKLIMIQNDEMVIKAVSNKVSLGKIMEQANATNQNQ